MIFFEDSILNEDSKIKMEMKKLYGFNLNKVFFIFKLSRLNFLKTLFFSAINAKLFLHNVKLLINFYNIIIGFNLKQHVYLNIKKNIELGNYRGFRHKNLLPVRGQHSRANASTIKKYNYKIIFKNLL